MTCPRCGARMENGICPECGFPVVRRILRLSFRYNRNKTIEDYFLLSQYINSQQLIAACRT